ncbi:XTP/dITP diphosphohydrolase/tetrapyrrole methylase family protein / MazG family protein [Nocardioides sp. YR527]|uniref:MazG nucleotide pyrophosphohydrolase domain-containing protein n=1 Tax=Nocardioides sp. YR527 TaxID=1881028 RepID=UPI00088F6CAE|nr:MazG nucleotide pyrophosphohydrolase domain-containing protein [Nocardioides sp. YR527]SDK95887.1 XTP/dITP diphosphohydrolase/tetrapyrrole methylase family protein / MazG family protein [Nocardioides sp. YR527]
MSPADEGRTYASGEGLVEFLDLMRLMRERCVWKSSQTHASLAQYLREESDEVLEAIDEADPEHLKEELGDLLLQVYFHAAIAEEAGEFTMDDVIAGLTAKMKRRNPHVFGPEADEAVRTGHRYTLEEVEQLWSAAKAAERTHPAE